MDTTRSSSSGTTPGTTSRAPAVARAAAILRLLAGEQAGLGVNEIARKVGLVPSTCFHILRTLVDEDFIAFDPVRKTYRPGAGLLCLVREALANGGFQQAVQPHLDRLAAGYNVTAVAIELDNADRPVVVALSRADSLVSLHVDVGSRFPAFVSATGRCIAARSTRSETELREVFENLPWERKPSFEEWHADVERVRRDGVAIDAGQYARGITVLATLIPRGSAATRGIALIGLDHQLTRPLIERLRGEILRAAAEVAVRLA